MNRASRLFMNWLFPDNVAERIARKTVKRKVDATREQVTSDWRRFVRKHPKRQSAYSKQWDAFQAELDRAYEEAARAAFQPIDDQKRTRIKKEFTDAITPGRVLAAAAIGYAGYRAAKYVVPKVIHQAKRLMVRVKAYTRRDDKNRAFPVRTHWRKAWNKKADVAESSTAFGQMMRDGVKAAANPAARAVRRIRRVAGKIANPFRGQAPRMG